LDQPIKSQTEGVLEVERRGPPRKVIRDNGTELTTKAMSFGAKKPA